MNPLYNCTYTELVKAANAVIKASHGIDRLAAQAYALHLLAERERMAEYIVITD